MAHKTAGRKRERGATLVMVTLLLSVFLGMGAIAIDIGMANAAAADAQRAADAAALAGASAYIDYPNFLEGPVDSARTDSAATARAYELALSHFMKADPIDSGEVYITFLPNDDPPKVRVGIARPGILTWFAHIFGINELIIGRKAAAVAAPLASTNNCIKPFLLPDRWYEADKVIQDPNSNSIMDAGGGQGDRGEQWFYQPSQGDYYAPFDPQAPSSSQTGLGSGLSGLPGDRGLDLLVKPQTGNAQRNGSFYQLLAPNMYGMDGNNVHEAVEEGCIEAGIGDVAHVLDGGHTDARLGIQALIDQSPDAAWDPISGTPTPTSDYPDWTENPRVIVVAFYNPIAIATTCNAANNNECRNISPTGEITFSNFARVFIENDPGNTGNITSKFIGFLSGGEDGGEEICPTCLTIRLVE
jgi:hypothetical protein